MTPSDAVLFQELSLARSSKWERMGLLPEVTYRLCQCPEQGKPENVNVVPVPQLPFAQDCPTHSKTKILEAVYRVLTSLLTLIHPCVKAIWLRNSVFGALRSSDGLKMAWQSNGMAVLMDGGGPKPILRQN